MASNADGDGQDAPVAFFVTWLRPLRQDPWLLNDFSRVGAGKNFDLDMDKDPRLLHADYVRFERDSKLSSSIHCRLK
jgi:hypothetical protein